MDEDYNEGDEYDLQKILTEETEGDTLIDEAPGATLRRNLTIMQGAEPSPVGKIFFVVSLFYFTIKVPRIIVAFFFCFCLEKDFPQNVFDVDEGQSTIRRSYVRISQLSCVLYFIP